MTALPGAIYPTVKVVCETDEHWEGCNLLYDALKRDGRMIVTEYMRGGIPRLVLNEDTPLYWSIDAPSLHRRQFFCTESAERVARPVRAFLRANGISVTEDGPAYSNQAWAPRDLVRVFTNGSRNDPYASDLPAIAMLPEMRRKVWELVRGRMDRPAL